MSDNPQPAAVQQVRVGADETPILRRLFELYLYDFSPILDMDVRADGGFVNEENWRRELARPGVDRFLLRVEEAWAGFAIVAHESWLDGRKGVHDVDEFFVLRRYRRRGVGRSAARALFAGHAGPWEVRVLTPNHEAHAFWRRVIDGFTDGRFVELPPGTNRWEGNVFSFESQGHAPVSD